MPTLSAAVLKLAWPELLSAALPIATAPSMNVTVPVGVPAAAVTVAVKVTDWPQVDGFNEDVNVVVVPAATVVIVHV